MPDRQPSSNTAQDTAPNTDQDAGMASAETASDPTVWDRLGTMFTAEDLQERIDAGLLWAGKGQHMRRVRSLDEPAPRATVNFSFGNLGSESNPSTDAGTSAGADAATAPTTAAEVAQPAAGERG